MRTLEGMSKKSSQLHQPKLPKMSKASIIEYTRQKRHLYNPIFTERIACSYSTNIVKRRDLIGNTRKNYSPSKEKEMEENEAEIREAHPLHRTNQEDNPEHLEME